MEGEKDKGNCLLEDKRNLQEHSIFFKCVFGKKNTPKNSYFMPKIRLKMPKIKLFRQKYFLRNCHRIFGGIFGGFQEVILCDQKISKVANVSK